MMTVQFSCSGFSGLKYLVYISSARITNNDQMGNNEIQQHDDNRQKLVVEIVMQGFSNDI
jgi:hypothetical protein